MLVREADVVRAPAPIDQAEGRADGAEQPDASDPPAST